MKHLLLLVFTTIIAVTHCVAARRVLDVVINVCGGRGPQAFDTIKSLLLFADEEHPVRVHLFVEPADQILKELLIPLNDLVDKCGKGILTAKLYAVDPTQSSHDATYWSHEKTGFFKNRYKCSAQRFYSFQAIHESVQAALYLDTDVLLLQPVARIWEHLDRMSHPDPSSPLCQQQQLQHIRNHPTGGASAAALPPCQPPVISAADHCASSYADAKRVPYYGERGLQAGVLFVNITRYKQLGVLQEMQQILSDTTYRLREGDQDALNIYGFRHPDRILQMPTEYNWWGNFNGNCSVAHTATNPVGYPVLLHGADMRWYLPLEPEFVAIYKQLHALNVCEPPGSEGGSGGDASIQIKLNDASHVLTPPFWRMLQARTRQDGARQDRSEL